MHVHVAYIGTGTNSCTIIYSESKVRIADKLNNNYNKLLGLGYDNY